ncbi:MAG: hypothetical protein M0Q93_09425 [Terrimicrobiaceae bacterium]|nr:hypothetical protein [Terrimicrobiaceae bacterium]
MKKPKIGAVKCADSKRSRLAAFLVAILATVMLPLAAHAKQDSLPGMGVQPAEYFYTGKPYDSDMGAYTFKYRNYDPELNRWTTADPSGFPDGANNQLYAAIPTTDCDPQGLRTSLGQPGLPSNSNWAYGNKTLVAGNLYLQTRARWEYTGWAYTGVEGVGNMGEAVTFGVTAVISGNVSVTLSGGITIAPFNAGSSFTASGGISAGGQLTQSKPATEGVEWEAKGLIGTGQVDIEAMYYELVDGQYVNAVGYSDYVHDSYTNLESFKVGLGIEWFE